VAPLWWPVVRIMMRRHVMGPRVVVASHAHHVAVCGAPYRLKKIISHFCILGLAKLGKVNYIFGIGPAITPPTTNRPYMGKEL